MENQPKLFEPIRDSDISQAVVRQIKDLMRKGKLESGDQLPGERDLTLQLGVSRVALRESFRALEATGFIKTVPGRGTFIQDPSSDTKALASMMWSWSNGGDQVFAELFEVRIMLEVEAAGLAARRATPAALADIAKALDGLARAVASRNAEDMAAADIEFHQFIFIAAENKLLLKLIDAIAVPLRENRIDSFRMSGGLPATVRNHRVLLQAIQSRKPERARLAMARHLHSTRRRMLHYLAKLEEFGGRDGQ